MSDKNQRVRENVQWLILVMLSAAGSTILVSWLLRAIMR